MRGDRENSRVGHNNTRLVYDARGSASASTSEDSTPVPTYRRDTIRQGVSDGNAPGIIPTPHPRALRSRTVLLLFPRGQLDILPAGLTGGLSRWPREAQCAEGDCERRARRLGRVTSLYALTSPWFLHGTSGK